MNGELSGGTNGINYERTDVDKNKDLTSYAKRKPEPMVFGTSDVLMAFGMLVCGFLYWNLIKIVSLGLGVTLFTVILCGMVLIYLKAAGLHQTKTGIALLGLILLFAANFSLFDGIFIKLLDFIFLSLCFVYWVCVSTGMRLEEKISIYLLSDMLRQLFVMPFYNFTGCFGGVRQVFSKTKKGKGVLSGLLGILLFLPILILVVTLLSDADAAFESLISRLQFSLSENVVENLADLILGVPVACYLFGLVYGDSHKRLPSAVTIDTVDRNVRNFRFAPEVTVYSALTALSLIYVVFFLAQTSYLFSAFRDSLPDSMTYAEYARRGFFELCTVSGINLGVIATAHLIVKRERIRFLKTETAVLCIFTLMLIATAMSKMGMYISYYGLTRLRVFTSWFMIVLLLLFVVILLRQFRDFNGTRIAAAGCICLFLVLSFGNMDGMIAKYNIDRYQAGTLNSLDVKAFGELSDGAVPYLYDYYSETKDTALKAALKRAMIQPSRGYDPEESDFRDFNLQTHQAEQIRAELLSNL
jgi:hypothetical protein